MNTQAAPIFEEIDRQNSCVVETKFSNLGLYITVEAFPAPKCSSTLIEIFFPHHRGFILVDEGDMPIWLAQECFRSKYFLYQVTSGGWFSNVVSGTGFLAIAADSCKEWLVVTANECVTVFSAAEPLVRRLPG